MNTTTPELDERAPAQTRDKGFTLIELIIVIVILGILTTVVVLAVGGLRDDAEAATCDTDRAAMETAVAAYEAREGTVPTSVQQLLDADYLKRDNGMHLVGAGGEITVDPEGECVGVGTTTTTLADG